MQRAANILMHTYDELEKIEATTLTLVFVKSCYGEKKEGKNLT
jgi:hypothetical protein